MVAARELMLASRNAGKRRELEPVFAELGWTLLSLDALNIASPEETAFSFLENALLKARHAAERCQQWVLAEDSGLSVPSLGGAPGVYSARYAGDDALDQENNELLLQRMRHLTGAQREAYFVCVMVLLRGPEDPDPRFARGVWQGKIAEEAKGAGGFGYDPVFLPYAMGERSAAELSLKEKQDCSHRAQALRKLLSEIQQDAA
ncbi:RdgB/HAM1 family non-canonical purine NTP pyrophosphatase [Acidithiobacillus sp. IBUN Pt1247-S3]|uniref:RdgB/HAM1 family non-canonical purine NTP pyrophosphatase n=1 Tax=Acidithiobacillus sp. IBUN Pt1247-S3 TaxID=3166642 RepID=UPI0034E4B082